MAEPDECDPNLLSIQVSLAEYRFDIMIVENQRSFNKSEKIPMDS